MSLESELKKARQYGIQISKDKLTELIRTSGLKQYLVIADKGALYVLIPVASGKL